MLSILLNVSHYLSEKKCQAKPGGCIALFRHCCFCNRMAAIQPSGRISDTFSWRPYGFYQTSRHNHTTCGTPLEQTTMLARPPPSYEWTLHPGVPDDGDIPPETPRLPRPIDSKYDCGHLDSLYSPCGVQDDFDDDTFPSIEYLPSFRPKGMLYREWSVWPSLSSCGVIDKSNSN